MLRINTLGGKQNALCVLWNVFACLASSGMRGLKSPIVWERSTLLAVSTWYPSAEEKRAALSLPTTQDANWRRWSYPAPHSLTFPEPSEWKTLCENRGISASFTTNWSHARLPPSEHRGRNIIPCERCAATETIELATVWRAAGDGMELITILEKTVSPGIFQLLTSPYKTSVLSRHICDRELLCSLGLLWTGESFK